MTERHKMPLHKYYNEAVEMAYSIYAHVQGEYPSAVMDVSRPHELEKHKKYRQDIYEPKTKQAIQKIDNIVNKIFKADDWNIDFPEQLIKAENETLEDYLTKNFPHFVTLENWLIQIAMMVLKIDANAVISVMPASNFKELSFLPDNEYFKPFPYVFYSSQVLEFVEEEHAVLLDTRKTVVSVGDAKKMEGLVLWYFDRNEIKLYEQIGQKSEWTFAEFVYTHGFGQMPVFSVGGDIKEFDNTYKLYKSYLFDCLPSLNEATRRYSDLQVSMNFHVHPERTEIATTECKTCKGKGEVEFRDSKNKLSHKQCSTCFGQGYAVLSPLATKIITPHKAGIGSEEKTPQLPGIAYVERPIESVNAIKQDYKDQLHEVFSVLNLEFATEEPNENSGVAKSLDREEMNSTLSKIAKILVENIIKPTIYFVSEWRYSVVLSDEKQRRAQEPNIKTPKSFDVVTTDVLVEKIRRAIEAKMSPAIIMALQAEYARKEFGSTSQKATIVELYISLDPLPFTTVEEKQLMYQSGLADLDTLILSMYLYVFLQDIFAKNIKFVDLNRDEQMKILDVYVVVMREKLNAGVVDSAAIDPNTSTETTSIEDEASARLKGSVGGVQGILGIQESVSKGVTQYEAGVALLIEIYKYSDEVARRILGDPIDLTTKVEKGEVTV